MEVFKWDVKNMKIFNILPLLNVYKDWLGKFSYSSASACTKSERIILNGDNQYIIIPLIISKRNIERFYVVPKY